MFSFTGPPLAYPPRKAGASGLADLSGACLATAPPVSVEVSRADGTRASLATNH